MRFGITRLGLAVSVAIEAMFCLAVPAASASSPPPTDPAAVGPLTFCSQSGAQVTSGALSTQPFTWRAIDTTPAPSGYGKNGTATLFGYQPRPGVAPGDWSGEEMTASARYSDPSHPMAAATAIDESLATFLNDYPLSSEGLVEVRVYLGSPGQPPYSVRYDAAYLHVSNGQWTQLSPGPDDCKTSGRSVSIETLTLPKKELRPSKQPTPGSSAAASASVSSSASTSPVANGASSSPGTNLTGSTDPSSDSSRTGRNVAILAALVVVAVLVGGLALRRRA